MALVRRYKRSMQPGQAYCDGEGVYESSAPKRQCVAPSPIRRLTKRRKGMVYKFMTKFRANTVAYPSYGSQEWITTLIQHVHEKPHHQCSHIDVLRWLKNEKFFEKHNSHFGFTGQELPHEKDTGDRGAPLVCRHSSGSGNRGDVTPEVVDSQNDSIQDEIIDFIMKQETIDNIDDIPYNDEEVKKDLAGSESILRMHAKYFQEAFPEHRDEEHPLLMEEGRHDHMIGDSPIPMDLTIKKEVEVEEPMVEDVMIEDTPTEQTINQDVHDDNIDVPDIEDVLNQGQPWEESAIGRSVMRKFFIRKLQTINAIVFDILNAL
ncbi:unnamed protein product [Orchesella dallaii]|uniref:Uncharacterized protein n=1 Tax=Orchesella dallaii TaxID=48710 RepID=A0ABP1Q762_9HEXA